MVIQNANQLRCRVDNCGEKHSSCLYILTLINLPSIVDRIHLNDDSNVCMATIPVVTDGTFHTLILLDTGSSATFWSIHLIDQLKPQALW